MNSDINDRLTYDRNTNVIDEVFNSEGCFIPHWSHVMKTLLAMNSSQLIERDKKIQRLLRDDGATYNPHESNDSKAYPWQLDAIPHVIDSHEWTHIESGLLERTELFNLILQDLYHDRTLIQHKVIPPEALFAHRGFLRACDRMPMPNEHSLILHSVDLMRNSQGILQVISDNTQNPQGMGYTLENRNVLSRTFPSLFRDSHVHRLAKFFQRFRQKLISLSRTDEHNRVVLLSPGTQDRAYFEHAYLANYMGFPVVQSTDLLARDGYLWMKSLDGLKRIDVLLRRVNDMDMDPVELRSDSHLGVAGLLDVIRQGNIIIANPIGSGILENPIFFKYLPQISQHFFGRALRLETTKTYWCHDPDDMAYIESHIEQMVIKPIIPGKHFRGSYCHLMSTEERNHLMTRIKNQPYRYIAQDQIIASHTPCFINGSIQSQPFSFRSFVIASEASYSVLPGALTQVNNPIGSNITDLNQAVFTKDTWIMATEPGHSQMETDSEDALSVSASETFSLPSRVIENLFWMGRYAERAEAGLRIIRTFLILSNSEEGMSEQTQQRLLLAIREVTSCLSENHQQNDEVAPLSTEDMLRNILNEGTMTSSIRSTLNALLFATDKSKELLSMDTLRMTNNIRDEIAAIDMALNNPSFSIYDISLEPLIGHLLALSGLSHESIRNAGWRFTDLGKRLERGIQTATLIKVLLSDVTLIKEQSTLLTALLLTLELLITYRRRYRSDNNLVCGLDLVLIDQKNPRSLIFQFEALQSHIQELAAHKTQSRELSTEERIILEGISHIKLSHLSELLNTETQQRENLIRLLNHMTYLMNTLGTAISDKYFDHSLNPHQLVDSEWSEQA